MKIIPRKLIVNHWFPHSIILYIVSNHVNPQNNRNMLWLRIAYNKWHCYRLAALSHKCTIIVYVEHTKYERLSWKFMDIWINVLNYDTFNILSMQTYIPSKILPDSVHLVILSSLLLKFIHRSSGSLAKENLHCDL